MWFITKALRASLVAASLSLLVSHAGAAISVPILPAYSSDEDDMILWAKLVSSGVASWEYSYKWAKKWGLTAQQWKDRHDGSESGRWMTAVGWIVFNIHTSSKAIYISSTGNDSNDGLTTGTPKLTIAGGLAIRNSGDHLLLKRGETFSAPEAGFNGDSGIDADHPTVIGAYGTGARPIINSTIPTSTCIGFFSSGAPHSNYAIIHLDMRCPSRDPDDVSFAAINQSETAVGIFTASGFDGLHIEGCSIAWFKDGIQLQGANSSTLATNIVIRRNVIKDCYGGSVGWGAGNTRSQGMFFANCGDITLEENAGIRCGWCEHASVNIPYDLSSATVSGTPTTTVVDLDIGVTDLPDDFFNGNGASITSGAESRSVIDSAHLGAGIWRFTVSVAWSLAPSGTAAFFSNKRNMGRRSTESHYNYGSSYQGEFISNRDIMIRCSGNDKQNRDGCQMTNCHSYGANNSSYAGASDYNADYVSSMSYNVIQHVEELVGSNNNGLEIKGHCLCHHNILTNGGKGGISFAKTSEVAATVSVYDNIIHSFGTSAALDYNESSNDATDDITFNNNKCNQPQISTSTIGVCHYRPTLSGVVTNVKFTNNVCYNSTAGSKFGMSAYGATTYTVSAFETAMGATSNGNSFADPSGDWPDPDRDILTYYTSLGLGASPTIDDVIALIEAQYWDGVDENSNGANWNPAWQADAINSYIRAGFNMSDPEEVTNFKYLAISFGNKSLFFRI